MRHMETICLGIGMAVISTPAFAGLNPAPAPIAGVGIGAVLLVGIGAVLLVGLGYRALKRRIRS